MSIDLLLKQIIFFNKIFCVNRFTQYVNRFTTERKLFFMKMFCVNRFNQGANRFTTESEAFSVYFLYAI